MPTSRDDIVIRLNAIAAALDITDRELANRAGCGKTQWSNFVSPNQTRRITVAAATRLCDEFNVTLDWIFRGKTALMPQDILDQERALRAARQHTKAA